PRLFAAWPPYHSGVCDGQALRCSCQAGRSVPARGAPHRRRMTMALVSWLASPIRAIAPGRDEQRHVIVRRGIGDVEAHRHMAEERLVACHPLPCEVFANVEEQLIGASGEVGASKQRLIGAAIGIGAYCDETFATAARRIETPKLDAHIGGRAAAREVEDMCGERAC